MPTIHRSFDHFPISPQLQRGMGAESSVGRGNRSDPQDVIVIDSSDEDFQRPTSEPVRQKRSLALRALVDDASSTNSELKREVDTEAATADKRRKTFPAVGTLKCAPIVDLRPLLQQAKLRVRQPDGSYTWPHHLRMNIENLEAQRQAVQSAYANGVTSTSAVCGEQKTTPAPAAGVCIENKATQPTPGDAEEKSTPPTPGGAEEKTTPATCANDEEMTPPATAAEEKTMASQATMASTPGSAEEKTRPATGADEEEKTTSTTPGGAEEKTMAATCPDDEEKTMAVVCPRGKKQRVANKKMVSAKKKAPIKPSTVRSTDTTGNRLEASWGQVKTAMGPDGSDDSDFEAARAGQDDSDNSDGSNESDFESDPGGGGDGGRHGHRAAAMGAPARPGGPDDSDFESESDEGEGDNWQGRQIRVAASRAAVTGALSPAQWPSNIVHLREMFNPANIQLEYAYNFGLCACESRCRHPTCMNASLSLFCAPNCCQFRGECGNALVESNSVAIATRGDNRGLSLVATQAIDEGTILGQYLGEMVLESAEESERPNTEGY